MTKSEVLEELGRAMEEVGFDPVRATEAANAVVESLLRLGVPENRLSEAIDRIDGNLITELH